MSQTALSRTQALLLPGVYYNPWHGHPGWTSCAATAVGDVVAQSLPTTRPAPAVSTPVWGSSAQI